MVEKKEEDNQQEEIKEPDSDNVENEKDNNDGKENTDSEETNEDENTEDDSLEKEIETLKEEKIRYQNQKVELMARINFDCPIFILKSLSILRYYSTVVEMPEISRGCNNLQQMSV